MESRKISRFEWLIPWVSAGIMAIVFSFGLGLIVGKSKLWPYEPISQAVNSVQSVLEMGKAYPPGLVVVRRAEASQTRVFLPRPDAVVSGYRAIMGFDDGLGTFAVWLYDGKGQLLHTWPIRYDVLDPDGPLGRSDSPHGMKVLPDGSVLMNFDRVGLLARIDTCGNPVWVKQGSYHHSIDRAPDGSYWTWNGVGSAYSERQNLVNFDPNTGETIRSIELIENVARRSPASGMHLSIPADYKPREAEKTLEVSENDIFHPNDIEVLTPEMASAFPMFKPGDLLISVRNLDLIAVLDGTTAEMKWAQHGPWRQQHDPDFLSDGTISVYNNNSGRNYSSIIVVDPATGNTRFKYPEGAPAFYSRTMGKHQQLPDGGVQVVVPDEGRVFEADAEGNLTFEFNNIIDGGRNAHVENAVWVPLNYFTAPPYCGR